MVQTAKLTELVEIQQLCVSGNSFGAPIEKWETFGKIYMSILNQRGNTNFNAPGNVYNDAISFYGRFINLSKKGFRVLYKENIYELVNVTPIQRNQAIILDCIGVQ